MSRIPAGFTAMLFNSRSCGTCQLCCEILSVDEIKKPERQRCANQCDKGCSIYETRPGQCRDFECFWLAEGRAPAEMRRLRDDERPDKVGVVLDITRETKLKLPTALLAHFKDRENPGGKGLLRRLTRHLVVISVFETERTIAGPHNLLRPWEDALKMLKSKGTQ